MKILIDGETFAEIDTAIRQLESGLATRARLVGDRHSPEELFAAVALVIHAARCRVFIEVECRPESLIQPLQAAGMLADVEAALAADQVDPESLELQEPASSLVMHLVKYQIEFPHLVTEIERRRSLGDGRGSIAHSGIDLLGPN